MADTGHEHPNYMAIFWYLAVLTVLEIGVVFLPHYVAGIGKMTVGVLLCGFALAKASLVAMYFIIAGWGHEDRQRAALLFFLYGARLSRVQQAVNRP